MSKRRIIGRDAPVIPGAPTQSIVASNFRPINKNTLVGSADIHVTKWRFTFRGCLWHRKGEREWISFPAREWFDDAGQKRYVNLGEFVDRADAQRFSESAIAAIKVLADEAAQQSARPRPPYRSQPAARLDSGTPLPADDVDDLYRDAPPWGVR